MILPPCASEVLDGLCLFREVTPYRTSRFQSWSGVKVNIGEQREFRLAYNSQKIVVFTHKTCVYIYIYSLHFMLSFKSNGWLIFCVCIFFRLANGKPSPNIQKAYSSQVCFWIFEKKNLGISFGVYTYRTF